jgi:C1A family cysteine protease
VTSSEKGQAFMHFLARYGKTYSSKGELVKRFGIFVKNIEAVAVHNKGSGFKKGVNQFSDMTLEEFSQLYGKAALPKREKKSSSPRLESNLEEVQIPESVDWHKAGKTTVPSDQGGCGSCWAFTTAATMESAYAIRFNTSPERLSV